MVFRPEQMRKKMVAKFLGGYVESKGNRLQLDDFYESYCNFIIANARDYKQTLTEFRRSIVEIFPNAEVKDGVAIGIAKRVKVKPIEKVIDPFHKLMEECFSDMQRVYPRKLFTANELAFYSKQKIDEVEAWLNTHPHMFYNKLKNKYSYINGE